MRQSSLRIVSSSARHDHAEPAHRHLVERAAVALQRELLFDLRSRSSSRSGCSALSHRRSTSTGPPASVSVPSNARPPRRITQRRCRARLVALAGSPGRGPAARRRRAARGWRRDTHRRLAKIVLSVAFALAMAGEEDDRVEPAAGSAGS